MNSLLQNSKKNEKWIFKWNKTINDFWDQTSSYEKSNSSLYKYTTFVLNNTKSKIKCKGYIKLFIYNPSGNLILNSRKI